MELTEEQQRIIELDRIWRELIKAQMDAGFTFKEAVHNVIYGGQ